ncbi:MAG: AAA family ATPase [Candidatus Cloacimonetes bacterium]|nr:AAA family ATPase [Candidatus Cloacimonadota bacterium]
MRYLYLDNFRGFQNALIPLRNVNFLVGENSTGKTSVMAALCVLMEGPFGRFKFNNLNFQLGTFDEIVSHNLHDNQHFRIASIKTGETDKDTTMAGYKFMEYRGLPGLRSSIRVGPDGLKKFLFKKKRLYRKVHEEIDTGFHNILGLLATDIEEGKYVRGVEIKREGSHFRIVPDVEVPLKDIGNYFDTLAMMFETCSFQRQTCWMAPIRSAPQAIYTDYATEYDSTGVHIPYKLHEVYQRKHKRIISALHKFGRSSGLFEEIRFDEYIISNPGAPFRIFVKLGEHFVNIKHVGYGVSQILPIIGDLLMKKEKTVFFIQQPEIHMHPKAQAAFGKFLHDYCEIEEDSFVFLETHSDFIIDRFRLEQQESEEKVDSQVLYFERNDEGNKVFPLPIDGSGKFESKPPKSYRKFFVNESMEMLDL